MEEVCEGGVVGREVEEEERGELMQGVGFR